MESARRVRGDMMIMFSGARFHDFSTSCVYFRVLCDGEIFKCAIRDEELKSLCNDISDAVEIFDSCRMFILDCILGIIHCEENCFSNRILIENSSGSLKCKERRPSCNT
jgi:hypothetical protein